VKETETKETYEIIEEIGKGAFSTVYLSRNTHTNEFFVLKMLN
jgi:serine/threonine protein kinase